MNRILKRTTIERLTLCGLLAFAAGLSGCHSVTKASHAIPASRLDPALFPACKSDQVPILFTALGQDKPKAHRVAAGDTLSIFIYGILPASVDNTPVLEQFQTLNQRYYPPRGSIVGPSTGLPVPVQADGTLQLPLIKALDVDGMTLTEVHEAIVQAYIAAGQINEGRDRVSVALITPRVHRVVVLRQDTPATPAALVPPGQVEHIHRGSGEVIDLPAYENDVLHALTATGGLPGTDAVNEILVMRNFSSPEGISMSNVDSLVEEYNGRDIGPRVIRIPLSTCCGEPVQFGPADVVLEDGDVVFVPRRNEYFYTGGLLQGAKIPLPVDDDLDVLEAIALATGSTGGPLGQSGLALASGTPGHMIKPSRVLILRKLPCGEQIAIRVDLAKAMEDKKERIIIQPDDIVMLNFKPGEAVLNGALNIVNFSVLGSLNQ